MDSRRSDTGTVIHFYDLTCPFCYVAQPLDAALRDAGAQVTHLPFRAHPELPAEGLYLGPRSGPMYDRLEALAKAAGLPLRWPPRLPPSRLALGASEWVRIEQAPAAGAFRAALFAAHFAGGRDVADRAVVLGVAHEAGVDTVPLAAALDDGTADRLLMLAEHLGREVGVAGTPSWSAHGRLVTGMQTADTLIASLKGDDKW